MLSFFKKIIRLAIHVAKGNFDYAFGQFNSTRFIRRKTLHWFYANNDVKYHNAAVFNCKLIRDRYAFNIINNYKLANYDVFVKPNYAFYSSSKGLYFDDIFTFLRVGYFKSFRQLTRYKNIHYIYDYETYVPSNILNLKVIKITSKDAIRAQSLKFPFNFHPNAYKNLSIHTKQELELALSSKHDANISGFRIFFAGSTKSDDYNKINFNFSELLDRNLIFNHIKKIYNYNITYDLRSDNLKSIFINDSLLGEKINEIELFKIMKSSHFFIAPPGFEIPFCHNLYEAMACGMIPILQYGSYLYPNLQNRINCLSFNNLDELEECISVALNMKISEINEMKINVKKYYQLHCAPIAFISKLQNLKEEKATIFYVSGLT